MRRRLAQLRTERRRKHNRILKADSLGSSKDSSGRPEHLQENHKIGAFPPGSCHYDTEKSKGMSGRRKVWVEKLLKHHSQRRLKRLHWKWSRYSAWCKKRRLAAECVQRFIRSFLSRVHCRNWLRRRKRNNIASNRMRIRLQRRDHRIIMRAWDQDAKAIILARRIKMSSRIAKWYRNRRVSLASQGVKVEANPSAKRTKSTDRIAGHSIDLLATKKMQGRKYCNGCGAPTRPSTALKD